MINENSTARELQKFALNLLQRLNLRSLNKHVALQNLSNYDTWKNIRQQYKYNKLNMMASTQNDELELADGFYSVSDI